MNIQQYNIEPYVLVDEVSETEIYVGTSRTFNTKSKPIWRIKRFWKVGSVWMQGFPDGRQDFIHVWDDRITYNYI
ncbi:MAG: hypothetical protein ACOCZ5_00275 [bacterium]